jgi:cytochrome P450
VRPAGGGELPPSPRLPRAVQTLVFWQWPLSYLERCGSRYGARFTLHTVGHPPLVFLSDADDVRAMLTASADVLHPGRGAGTIEPLVGAESFMLMEGEEHLYGRRAILPALHAKLVRRHAEWVADVARRHVASWPRDTPVALHPRLRTLTLEVILGKVFAATAVADDDRLHVLGDRLLALLSITDSTVLSAPLLAHDPRRRAWTRFERVRAEVDELIYALIDEHRHDERRRAAAPDGVLAGLLGARNPDGSPMSRRQVRDNVMSVVLAGHETTASELAWAFQLLVHNPAVLDRLTREIDRDGGEEYLAATVQEVLRHRPVFLFTIPRAVARAVRIGGWTYRPPAQLLGCIYLMHHDPRVYPEPDRFLPERFMQAPPQPQVWLPWGGGRKRCPGAHLATLEMKTVLRTVLSTATVHAATGRMERPRWRSVIVTPRGGSRVVLRRRGAGSA